jgi:two-component sensor histidine kinase
MHQSTRDISERKRQEERQRLLLREMNHRIKNLFMLTSSLVTLSERAAHGAADLAEKLRGRIAALARAHDLTMPDLSEAADGERTTTLFALLDAILDPHRDAGEARTLIRGCDIPISGSALTSLALVLNEFATNSAKYGCLSAPEGALSIESSIDGEDFVLVWAEAGGPEITPAAIGVGFGSQLERVAIEGSLHGNLSREWAPSGLIIKTRVPLSRLSRQP